jgi:hypothetical protein
LLAQGPLRHRRPRRTDAYAGSASVGLSRAALAAGSRPAMAADHEPRHTRSDQRVQPHDERLLLPEREHVAGAGPNPQPGNPTVIVPSPEGLLLICNRMRNE